MSGYPHQPGSPEFDGADAYEAYQEEMAREPPQTWVDCDACGGDGYIVRRVTVYEHGCGFPHDDSAEETCGKCHGARGWMEDVEEDR